MTMEENQITMDNVLAEETPKKPKETPFLKKFAELEKQVAKLENRIDTIIKALRS